MYIYSCVEEIEAKTDGGRDRRREIRGAYWVDN